MKSSPPHERRPSELSVASSYGLQALPELAHGPVRLCVNPPAAQRIKVKRTGQKCTPGGDYDDFCGGVVEILFACCGADVGGSVVGLFTRFRWFVHTALVRRARSTKNALLVEAATGEHELEGDGHQRLLFLWRGVRTRELAGHDRLQGVCVERASKTFGLFLGCALGDHRIDHQLIHVDTIKERLNQDELRTFGRVIPRIPGEKLIEQVVIEAGDNLASQATILANCQLDIVEGALLSKSSCPTLNRSLSRPVFQHLTFGFCSDEFRVFPMISVGEHNACWGLPYKEGVGGSSPSTPTEGDS